METLGVFYARVVRISGHEALQTCFCAACLGAILGVIATAIDGSIYRCRPAANASARRHCDFWRCGLLVLRRTVSVPFVAALRGCVRGCNLHQGPHGSAATIGQTTLMSVVYRNQTFEYRKVSISNT